MQGVFVNSCIMHHIIIEFQLRLMFISVSVFLLSSLWIHISPFFSGISGLCHLEPIPVKKKENQGKNPGFKQIQSWPSAPAWWSHLLLGQTSHSMRWLFPLHLGSSMEYIEIGSRRAPPWTALIWTPLQLSSCPWGKAWFKESGREQPMHPLVFLTATSWVHFTWLWETL